MEVVGAAASAVTLLGAAVKGTEAVYQIISSFKQASSHAKSLESAINSLKTVLTQLQNDKVLAKDNPYLEDLKKFLKGYHADIQRYEKDLKKTQIDSKDSKRERISKKVKGAIQGEKDLLRILGEVTQRCATLGTQLNLFQCHATVTARDTVLELNAASSARANHDANQSTLLLQQSTSLSTIDEKMGNVQTSLGRIQDTVITTSEMLAQSPGVSRADHNANQSTLLVQQSATLSAIDGRVGNVQTSLDHVQDALSTMTEKMEQIPRVSHTQSEDIRTLLLALQSQISGLSNRSTGVQSGSQSQSIPTTESGDKVEKEAELAESIGRLRTLASQREGSVRNEEAESFIDDLECILHTIIALPDTRHATTPSKRKLEAMSGAEDISPRELKRLCRIAASSHSIDLNFGAPRFKPGAKGKISQRHRAKAIVAQNYEITVALNERRFSDPPADDNQLNHHQSHIVETLARVKIFQRSAYPTMLVAYLRQVQMQNGFSILNPVISIGRILPDDSPLFSIVQGGHLDQLKRLLMLCQCTLRDRDSWGTPLLHYAMDQPEMCRFLVENGADVDEIATRVDDKEFQNPPILQHLNDLEERNEKKLQAILECRRVVLQAGADPTINSSEWSNSVFENVSSGTVDSVKVILDHGEPFFNLEERNIDGNTPLLHLAHNYSLGYDAMRFKLLLDRGANIHARDNRGMTCLHIAVQSARPRNHLNTRVEEDMEAITLLTQRGADIFTTDYSGRSIFDDAYVCDHEKEYPRGSYRGDLWDAALFRCGHGEHIQRPEERMCHYTQWYTEEEFARLWEGMAQDCPYISTPSAICPDRDEVNRRAEEYNRRREEYIRHYEANYRRAEDSVSEEEEEDSADSNIGDEMYLTDSEQDGSEIGYRGGIVLGEVDDLDGDDAG